MHTLLEQYLSEVAASLRPLPPKRRDEELQEMRQHLLNAVIVNREMGQSEDEAAVNAVKQFGTPEELGQSIVLAWQRGERMQKRDFWGIALFTVALSQLVPRLLWLLALSPLNDYLQLHPSTSFWLGWPAILGGDICLYVLAGAVGGIVFSRQAIKGAMAGVALGISIHTGLYLYRYVYDQIIMLHTHGVLNYAPELGGRVAQMVTILFTIPAAWAGSRWRQNRARLARN